MMQKELIKANLASVRAQLAETFPHITDVLLFYAPTPKMHHTIHRILMDIITTEQVFIDRLKGIPRKTDEELDQPLEKIKTVEGMINALDETRKQTLDYIDSLTEQQLTAPFKVSQSLAEELQLTDPPAIELLRYVVRHEAYHTGQIFSYIWASGDDPYLW